MTVTSEREIRFAAGPVMLYGDLAVPPQATALVIFAHGSGSSRHSPRNRFVAQELQKAGFATLLFDLLTPMEDEDYDMRFDIELLATRLADVARWARTQPDTEKLEIGLFGASTGAAAALVAAAELGTAVKAIVSRGGRPDLAMSRIPEVTAPTLLIVGGLDGLVIDLNRQAFTALRSEKLLEIVEGATHLFEEPGKLEIVARLAVQWFRKHLQ